MKILFVDDAHTFGGAQIAAVNLAAFINKNLGHEVLFCCSSKNQRLVARLAYETSINTVDNGYAAIPFFIITHALLIWRIPFIIWKIRSIRPDVIIVNMAGLDFGWLYVYSAKLLGIRLICWLHNPFRFTDLLPFKYSTGVVRDGLSNLFAKFIVADLYTVSNSARDYLLKRLKRKSGIKVLGNTISFPRDPSPGGPTIRDVMRDFQAKAVAVVPGRVSYGDKGQDKIIARLPELQERSIAVVFIGDGENLEALKAACANFKNVFFIPWQQSVVKYLLEADVVLLPSRFEAQGLIAMETMLLGVPMIASNIPAFVELAGLDFTADYDDRQALYEKINWILSLSKHELSMRYNERIKKCLGDDYKIHVAETLGCDR